MARAVSVLRFVPSQKQISFFRYILVCSAWLSCESLRQSEELLSVWNRGEKKRQPENHSRVQYPVQADLVSPGALSSCIVINTNSEGWVTALF